MIPRAELAFVTNDGKVSYRAFSQVVTFVKEIPSGGGKCELLGTSKGFTFFFCKTPFFDSLVANSKMYPTPIATLSVNNSGPRKGMVGNTYVVKQFRGLGLGPRMYSILLSRLGTLRSSDDLSPGSSAIWKNLVTKHKGVLIVDSQRYEVLDWKLKNKVTYPVIDYKGALRCLCDIRGDKKLASAFYEITK